MPPKKRAPSTTAEPTEASWKWTPENDRALFLLTMGRSTFVRDDWEKIAAALSPAATWNGVRQRVGKFRAEQKTKFAELGWEMPDNAAPKAKGPAGKKRKGSEDDEDAGEEMGKGEKSRAKKVKKVDEVDDDEDEDGGEEVVKEEDVDGAI